MKYLTSVVRVIGKWSWLLVRVVLRNIFSKTTAKRVVKLSIASCVLYATFLFGSAIGTAKQSYKIRPNPDILGPAFYDAHENQTATLVTLDENGYGSGGSSFSYTLNNGKNILITNAHVCQAAVDKVTVEPPVMTAILENGLEKSVQVRYLSGKFDLCFLDGPTSIKGFPLADHYFIGEYAEAFGHPGLGPLVLSGGLLLDEEYVTIREPLVDNPSCGSREGDEVRGNVCLNRSRVIDTNIIVKPGSSGSPVINLQGEIVGVICSTVPGTNNSQMVPLEDLRQTISDYEAGIIKF